MLLTHAHGMFIVVSPRQTAIYVMCPSDHDIGPGIVRIICRINLIAAFNSDKFCTRVCTKVSVQKYLFCIQVKWNNFL